MKVLEVTFIAYILVINRCVLVIYMAAFAIALKFCKKGCQIFTVQ